MTSSEGTKYLILLCVCIFGGVLERFRFQIYLKMSVVKMIVLTFHPAPEMKLALQDKFLSCSWQSHKMLQENANRTCT